MKRKLALLLALVMILSLVPANVFAQAAPPPGSGVSTALAQPPSDLNMTTGAAFTVTLAGPEVHSRLLAGIPFDVTLQLSGAAAGYLHFRSHSHPHPHATIAAGTDIGNTQLTGPAGPNVNPIGSSPRTESTTIVMPAPTVADPTATVNVVFTMTIMNRQQAHLTIAPSGPIPILGLAALPVDLGPMFGIWFNANAGAATLTAYLGGAPGGIMLAQGPLANFGAGVNIAYSGPDPVVFEWDANLGQINITEQRVGAIAPGIHTIRLTAPLGYTWGGHTRTATYNPSETAAWNNTNVLVRHGAFPTFTFGGVNWHVFEQLNGQEELVIWFNVTRAAEPQLANRPGTISLRGLSLLPAWDTVMEGDLHVRVQMGHVYQPTLSANGALHPPAGLPSPGSTFTEQIRLWNVNWRGIAGGGHTETFLVAQRRVPSLTLSMVEATADLPQLRSGYAIGVAANRPLVETLESWTNTINQVATGQTTGRTGIIRVQENVVNAMDLARGRPVTFEVPEGVIITGVEWRYINVGENAPAAYPWTFGVQGGPQAGFAHGRGFQVPRPQLHESQSTSDQNVIFTDNTVTLRPNLDLHQTPGVRPRTVRLEVRLYVSVEAGFAGGSLDEELVVEVHGPGVARLGADGRGSVVAAFVYDPVTIEHSPGPVQISLVGREQNIYHTDAGRITITETEGGMLQRGTVLRIGVVRHYGTIGWGLSLSRGDVITDTNTGLGLTVRRIETPGVGNEGVTWINVEVTRESAVGNPGTITFDGLTLFGHVYQGERYYLVVTGPAIAENHFGLGTGGGVSSRTNPSLETGVFVTPPYYVEIIEIVGQAGGEEGPTAASLDGVEFETGVNFRGVANPLIWRRLPGMHHEGGFVSMRAFALAAGVDESNISWASNVATISGFNYAGQAVIVSVTPGSVRATVVVDGIPSEVDIAMMADGLTGPEGTVRPIHEAGTIYLPLRFMFNVFGYSDYYNLARTGQRAVISAR